MSLGGISPAEWAQVSELIALRMGLHFPPDRLPDLKRGIAGAARELGMATAPAFARHLLAQPLDTGRQQLLARHLTIGETYFFRDASMMDAIRCHVLPELIRQRRGHDQRLRIWSAGCASGEEAYSLAILLHRLLPDLADWRVTITATDINPRVLNRARAGVYGEWSFRNVPAALKHAYFERRADGKHVIAPQIRKLVNFEYLNLVQDADPALQAATSAVDVLFCRNVLMYFTASQVRCVVARLRQALAGGGWLAVSPCETSQVLFSQFTAVDFPGAVLYRKGNDADPAPATAFAPARVPEPPTQQLAPPPPDPSQQARVLANEGKLPEALLWCERWILADKLEPAAHYVRAVVLMEQGGHEQAREALRRAIFLEPGFVLAHFALANLARRDGRSAEACRHFANVRRMLQAYEPGDLLPHGDGLSAGQLAEMLGVPPGSGASDA